MKQHKGTLQSFEANGLSVGAARCGRPKLLSPHLPRTRTFNVPQL